MDVLYPNPGFVIEAVTIDSTGNGVHYILTSDGHISKSAFTLSTAFHGNLDSITSIDVSLAYNAGTRSDFKLARTYFSLDENLTEANVKTIATGWGWTFSAFTPGSLVATNTDWATGSAPTGWTNSTTIDSSFTGTATNSASGTYPASTAADVLYYKNTFTDYVQDFTLMMRVDILANTDFSHTLQMGRGSESVAQLSMFYSGGLTLEATFGSQFNDFTPVSTTGPLILALTKTAAGAIKMYLLENSHATQVVSLSTTFTNLLCMGESWVTLSTTTGTPSNHKLTDTYVKYNDALTQSAIETIATGWGWV